MMLYTARCDGCGRFLANDAEVVQVPIRDSIHPYTADWATYHPGCAGLDKKEA